MRKYFAIAFILFITTICSACTKDNVAETSITFTDGIWIKKYLDTYACFKLETPDGYQIVCDPYNIDEILQPDIVVESHQHGDHNDTTSLEQPYQLVTEPGEYKIDDVEINGYAGKHNKGDTINTNTIFVYKVNDITIAHFASQGELPSDEVLEQIGTVDILLIQIFMDDSYAKLGMEEADTIISKLNPKIIIPEHGDVTAGAELAKHLNVTEEVETSGSIIITREILDSSDSIRVINLDHLN